jgi:hypothetical protein
MGGWRTPVSHNDYATFLPLLQFALHGCHGMDGMCGTNDTAC